MGNQSDLAYVEASTASALQAFADAGRPLPLVELRRLVQAMGAPGDVFAMTYTVGGETRHAANAPSDPVLSKSLSFIERTFLSFRTITTGVCAH